MLLLCPHNLVRFHRLLIVSYPPHLPLLSTMSELSPIGCTFQIHMLKISESPYILPIVFKLLRKRQVYKGSVTQEYLFPERLLLQHSEYFTLLACIQFDVLSVQLSIRSILRHILFINSTHSDNDWCRSVLENEQIRSLN